MLLIKILNNRKWILIGILLLSLLGNGLMFWQWQCRRWVAVGYQRALNSIVTQAKEGTVTIRTEKEMIVLSAKSMTPQPQAKLEVSGAN